MLCWALFLLGGEDVCSCFENTNIKHQSHVGCVYQTRLHRYQEDTRLHYFLTITHCFFLRDSFKTKPSQLPNQKIHSAKKNTKTQLFSYNHPNFRKKKKSDPCNWTYSKLRRKKNKHDTFAFPGTRLKTTENWSFRRSQIDLRAISFVDSFLVKFGLKFYNVYNVSEIAPLPVRMLSKNVLLCVLCFRDMKKS